MEDLSMPRMILGTMTIDDMEDEILFTMAALEADPDAKAALPHTDGWLPRVDGLRSESRKLRLLVGKTSAAKVVANVRLDAACAALGDVQLLAVNKNRESPRWKKFFPETVSAFQRQPLADQVTAVLGWLSATDEPALEQHRDNLTHWAKMARAAVDATAQQHILRANLQQARDAHAQQLTADRDKLHDLLSDIARDQGLGRTWPDTFFRSGKDE
jgi:hypothetical protein